MVHESSAQVQDPAGLEKFLMHLGKVPTGYGWLLQGYGISELPLMQLILPYQLN